MATSLPADATKANSDAATDDPKQSILTDVAGGIDFGNLLKAALGQAAQLNVSDGLEIIAQAAGTPDDLRVKLQAASGLLRAAAGLALDIAALQKQSYTAIADTGAADAYVLTLSPAVAAYAAYQRFSFVASAVNTGASTLNINGLGVKNIKKWKVGTKIAPEAGDILANQVVVVEYDGTDFVLLSTPVGEDYLLYEHHTASGASGGATAASTWEDTPLTREAADTGGHGTLAANRITLAAGVYELDAWRSIHNTGVTKLRVRDHTDNSTIQPGGSVRAKGGGSDPDQGATIHVFARFTLAIQSDIAVQQYGEAEPDGFGIAASSGEDEIFGQVRLKRVR